MLHEGPTLLWTHRRGGLGSGWHRSSTAHHHVACSCLSVTREMLSMKGPVMRQTGYPSGLAGHPAPKRKRKRLSENVEVE